MPPRCQAQFVTCFCPHSDSWLTAKSDSSHLLFRFTNVSCDDSFLFPGAEPARINSQQVYRSLPPSNLSGGSEIFGLTHQMKMFLCHWDIYHMPFRQRAHSLLNLWVIRWTSWLSHLKLTNQVSSQPVEQFGKSVMLPIGARGDAWSASLHCGKLQWLMLN